MAMPVQVKVDFCLCSRVCSKVVREDYCMLAELRSFVPPVIVKNLKPATATFLSNT